MANVSKRKAITVSLSKIVNIVLCKSLTFVNLSTNIMGRHVWLTISKFEIHEGK